MPPRWEPPARSCRVCHASVPAVQPFHSIAFTSHGASHRPPRYLAIPRGRGVGQPGQPRAVRPSCPPAAAVPAPLRRIAFLRWPSWPAFGCLRVLERAHGLSRRCDMHSNPAVRSLGSPLDAYDTTTTLHAVLPACHAQSSEHSHDCAGWAMRWKPVRHLCHLRLPPCDAR